MNYYPFHIGDFRSGTANMSRLQRAIYRDLLDICYDTEKPLPLDMEELYDAIGAQSEEEQKIVERLLRFKFVKQDDGYHHEVCEQVIAEYHAKAEIAKANGKLGGRPPKAKPNPTKPSWLAVGTQPEPDRNPIATGSKPNQEPITIIQEPKEVKNSEAPAAPKPRIVKTRAADWEEEFDSMWALYPRKPGMSKAATHKAFSARVGEGASLTAMLAGVQAYAAYVLANHTEPKYIKAPETFFGPGKHWESDWSPPARASPGMTKTGQANARVMEDWLQGAQGHD